MFFPKRSLPVLHARLSPHGQTPGHNNSPFCNDRFPGFTSGVQLFARKPHLVRTRHSMSISNAMPSSNVVSIIRVVGNTPRNLKPFWNQCESGTLIQPLKAHVWSQRRHIISTTLNTVHSLNKHGRDQGVSTQVPTKIIYRKNVLRSGLGWRARLFSTNVRSYSLKEEVGSTTENEYLSIFSPSAQRAPIRDHLKNWQQQHERLSANQREAFQTPITGIDGAAQNPVSQSGVDNSLNSIDRDDLSPEESHHFDETLSESQSGSLPKNSFLRKGDVVELRSNGEPMLAVFIRQLDDQSQFYTMTGKWVHRLDRRIYFVIPQMISATQLEPILPYLPTGQVPRTSLDHLNTMDPNAPRGAGAAIIAELNHFHRLTAEIVSKNGNQLNLAFQNLAHPTKRSMMTLEEITMKVLPIANPSELTYPALWAVHKTILRTENFQLNYFSTREFPQIHVASKKYAEDLARIRTWVRKYQEQITNNVTGIESEPVEHDMINPLPGFLKKARALIAHSRKSRDVTKHGRIGPIETKMKPVPLKVFKFNRDEHMIARFICDISCQHIGQFQRQVPFFIPLILRATGMYDGFELDLSTAFVFSQEIGQLPSWMNKETLDPMLPVQGYRDALRRYGRPATEDPKRIESFLDMADSMAPFRKDWADMPVFCIDNKQTRDIDDGVSIEQIQGDASACWVHVHIANPSAFIKPTSRSAQLAQELIASRYLIDRRQPMISSALADKCFSLANGRPCITFSAKVTNDGDIAETKISHGIIHNVKFMTPARLRHELDSKRKYLQSLTIAVGKREADLTSPSNPTGQNSETESAAVSPCISPSDLNLLRQLSEVSARRFRRRNQAGAINYPYQTTSEVSVDWAATSVQNTGNRRFEPNDPIISVTTQINPALESLNDYMSYNMLEDLMLLAGDVAASWCIERNIPVPYVGTLRNPEPLESPELYKQNFVDPAIINKGALPLPVFNHYMNLVGSTTVSPVPLKHLTIGLSAYCRVTSPLRRYGDLLIHWQIEAAIRRESTTGCSLIKNPDRDYLPFSFSQVEALGPRIMYYERLIRSMSRTAESHWILQLLFRAFYFNEAILPSTFNVFILQPINTLRPTHFGMPTEMRFLCDVEENEATSKQGGAFYGDIWEARITKIDCYSRRVWVEAIRLVSREDVVHPAGLTARIFHA